ncbi:hypothetical protein [Neisseria bacilliformis]|uniref:hypothetical protein n=1 Tax=Neisseria bacilliformis TaxID=267212 RepID=UPI0028EE7066|nr:hypothetical protein [Neisseria bacilliformis]
MSKLQSILKSVRHDDEYIHCREAVELIAKETDEEIREVGRFLASLFFHIEFCNFSYYQYGDTGIFTKIEPTKLDMCSQEQNIALSFCRDRGVFVHMPEAKSVETARFIQHLIEDNCCTYYDFGVENDFGVYWKKDKFFEFCKHYGLFSGNTPTPNRVDSSDTEAFMAANRQLESDNTALKNNLNAVIKSGKSVTANMNIIGALLGTVLSENRFKSQAELKTYLLKQYDGYTGISDSNLDNVFSLANQYLSDPK